MSRKKLQPPYWCIAGPVMDERRSGVNAGLVQDSVIDCSMRELAFALPIQQGQGVTGPRYWDLIAGHGIEARQRSERAVK